MPIPVPSTPSTPAARQTPRSAIPTPSRSVAAAVDNSATTPTDSRLPSPSQLSKPKMSRQVTPTSDTGSADSARMPPPPAPPRKDPKEQRTAIRRTVGARNLKESSSDEDKGKEKRGAAVKKPVPARSMTLRSSTRAAGASATATTTGTATGAKKEEVPKRTLRTRTTSTSTNTSTGAAAAATTERKPALPKTVPRRELRSGAVAGASTAATGTSRRPLSMHADTTAATSASAAGPRKTTAPAAAAKTHRRNQSTPAAAPAALPRPGTSASMASNASKSRRPPFSTLQQNFAAPAPAPPTRRSLPPPPLDQATVHQQAQLLQLSCLHANSHATYAQLTASATAKLKRRFETLAREHSRSREQLARRQRLLDMAGLVAVVESPAAGITGKRRETMRSPEEKIQAFSEAIKKLEALQQNEHRVVAAAFGEWIAGYSPPSPGFGSEEGGWVKKRGRWIDGLGEDWRRQCLFTSRRIEAAVKAIESVVAAVVMEEEAGVVSVVGERWMEVAKGMLEESQGMMLVEGNVVQRERKALETVVASRDSHDVVVNDEYSEEEDQAVWA